ncbi:MAG: TetR/AcrR family transcriptional regulator [Planctomycetaceae bacterium]
MRVTAETRTATRQRILDESQTLFAAHGFEATTTREIAQAAGIGVGTLFNYFPTKESIAGVLISGAYKQAVHAQLSRDLDDSTSLEEELFAHVAAVLRKLRPFRSYLTAVLDTELSPLNSDGDATAGTFRTAHLEVVDQIAARHGSGESFTAVAGHLYWTLFVGVLAFWSKDASPKQEDTLALLDQSLAMFVGWLTSVGQDRFSSTPKSTRRSRG